jgi:hypothetical protein
LVRDAKKTKKGKAWFKKTCKAWFKKTCIRYNKWWTIHLITTGM